MNRIRIHRRRRAAALLALLVLSSFPAVAPRAFAADPDWPNDTGDGWRKVLSYGRCALQVFGAVTPAQWASAILDCTRLYLAEPPLSGGQ